MSFSSRSSNLLPLLPHDLQRDLSPYTCAAAARGGASCLPRCGLALWSIALSFLVFLSGCADVLFEKSPYAIRGFDVVYSAQEELTFLSWRLRESADPRRVVFELYQDGDYREIDLDETFYAAEPYACGDYYLCFQYQLPGRYTWPETIERPLRSIHEDEGLYAGAVPSIHEADITFGIDPIALGRNTSIDPRRFDWFEVNEVPLLRDYEWQLTDSARSSYLLAPNGPALTGECAPPVTSAWGSMGNRVEPSPSTWIEQPMCMAARPVRRDDGGVTRNVPFPPAPMLASEQQDYVPREERPPIIYLYLIDTLIRSESRCERTVNTLVSTFDSWIGRRVPDAVRLGSFTPLDPQNGRPLSGCAQRADQDYPVRQMIESLKLEAARLEPQKVRMVLVYMNNVELPPSQRVLADLQNFIFEINQIENIVPYGIAVGSNVVLGLTEWNDSIGWRPLTDETFLEDIEAWAKVTLPFRTMVHDTFDTPVQINVPVPAEQDPEQFKICSSTPGDLESIGLPASRVLVPPNLDVYPWPSPDTPDYLIRLEPQILLSNRSYLRVRVSIQVETCERFCNHPFRTAGQIDLPSWSDTRRCQL